MSVQILFDEYREHAVLTCTTSDVAFGPVFNAQNGKDAEERAEAFLRWFQTATIQGAWFFGKKDVRNLDAEQLQRAYLAWLGQEEKQYAAERSAEEEASRQEEREWQESERLHAEYMARGA